MDANYVRKDGMISRCYPDFMIKTNNDIYLVESKRLKKILILRMLLQRKIDWINKINNLNADDRMSCKWHYSLVSDELLY